jgi:peptidyl-prolyl cis-trans isomerase D
MAVSDSELEREFKVRNEKVKLQVVALTADAFLDKVQVTDADIAAHYESRKAEYRVGEQRKIRMLLLDRDQLHAKTVIPAADVQRAYNENITQYSSPEQIRASHILLETAGKDEAAVRKQAEDILAKVKAGGDFAALAKQYSEDEASKVNGGDLDYFGRGRMVPEFETAAFALEPGAVSELVKSQFGFHIIKVTDKRAAMTQSLDEVRAQIEDQLKWERTDAQIAARASELATRIQEPSDLDEVSRETGFPITESDLFAQGDPIPGLGVAPQVAAAAFRLADNEVSQPVASPRGTVFATVTERRDPYVPELTEVRERVRTDLTRERATELSRQRANEIAVTLRNASNFAAAAKTQGLEAKDTELITREAPLPDIGVSPEVDKVAFALPAGAVSEPVTTSDGTVIVRVVERDDVTPDEFRLGREAFREQLLSERRGRFFSAYMEKAKARMRIEVNNDVIRRLSTQTI